MPTDLKNKLPITFAGRPAHMSKEDRELWRRARTAIIWGGIALYFDVGVGGNTNVPEGIDDVLKRDWIAITQKRIDVLIEYIDHWRIIELRSNANPCVAGRLLVYKKLWLDDPPDTRRVDLTVITDVEDPDVKDLCDSLGIEFLKY